MSRSHCPRTHNTQRGAALMVMIVIMVVGIAAVLVSSLNSSALKITRDQVTADALAKAKDALIGSAALDLTRPGELPCHDVNDDGMLTMNIDYIGSNCVSPIGRLPWKTLGLTELRDGAGEHLWYAVAKTFWANGSTSLNSESLGNLTVNGIANPNNVIAIVFSPGAPVGSQSRSATNTASCSTTGTTVAESLCATNYLEGSNPTLSTATSPNPNYQSSGTTPFNDQLLIITPSQLWPPVEMRIAREAKSCLDSYAVANGSKYPWAASVSDTTQYISNLNTLFGRLPRYPTTDTNIISMLDAMSSLQLAVNSCQKSNSTSNQTTLVNAGKVLENTANTLGSIQPTTPPILGTVTNSAQTAGDKAQDSGRCADILSNPTTNSVQMNLNAANAGIPPSVVWPASCTTLSQPLAYWNDWKNQVFYQIDTQYSPSGSGAPSVPSLSIINSTGNYRAVVIVARSPLSGQVRNPTDPTTYLEGINQHTNPAPSIIFVSNSISNTNYQTVNDLALCLDGQVNCK
jgi:hypothetical protein